MTSLVRWARRAPVGAAAATILALVLTSSALAGGSSVKMRIPRVTVDKPYKVTITGFAGQSARLYLWLDFAKCAANPAGEYTRLDHTANGLYWKTPVKGRFEKVSRWETHVRRPDHACVYLQTWSAPLNSAGGLLAQKFISFAIH